MSLYGLSNYLMSELTTKLMMDDDFSKLVFYKDEDGDVLSLEGLDNPFIQLKGQVFQNRRPQKTLDKQDVLVFIYLKKIKRDGIKTHKANTVWINIGVLVHENCSKIENGVRENAIISAIEKVVEDSNFQSSIGNCSFESADLLAGIPFEWNGYVCSIKFDGFTKQFLNQGV